nr:hypothetical protein Iba_scaffold328162CG0010 [Ipomoea batatas]
MHACIHILDFDLLIILPFTNMKMKRSRMRKGNANGRGFQEAPYNAFLSTPSTLSCNTIPKIGHGCFCCSNICCAYSYSCISRLFSELITSTILLGMSRRASCVKFTGRTNFIEPSRFCS